MAVLITTAKKSKMRGDLSNVGSADKCIRDDKEVM
jgi:hypothetical protein